MDKDEMEDLMGALLELRSQYRKLQWYGEVNRRGFLKITKKLDKKVTAKSSSHQSRYMATKVDPKAFASNYRLTNDMRAINDWLSSLGDVKVFDDTSSVQSTGSLHRVSSKSALKVPAGVLDSMETAVRKDQPEELEDLVDNSASGLTPQSKQKLLSNLLQRAISCKARQVIVHLLSQLDYLDEEDDMNKRNIIHRLAISIGRSRALETQNGSASLLEIPDTATFLTAAEAPNRVPGSFKVEERDPAVALGNNDPSVKLLVHILDHLTSFQRKALLAKDIYGRLPLHYAAQYGLVAATEEIIKHMQDWGQYDVAKGIDSGSWQDQDGYAPLHLAVIGGHLRTTKALLTSEKWQGGDDMDGLASARKLVQQSGAVLALATKSNFYKIISLLVEAGVDINYQDEQGETALHIAARFGFENCARSIIEGSEIQKADLELAEKTFGWTPLFIACVDGHLSIVELLVAAGAETNKPDFSGWLPTEHAALRGHLNISRRLAELKPSVPTSLEVPESKQRPTSSGSPPAASSIEERRSNIAKDSANRSHSPPEPIKTFGHRYLTKEAMVLVSLGSMDMRKNLEAVKLDSIPLADAHSTQLDTALSIVVSATGATGEPTVIDLPVHENISTTPITFYTSNASKVKLLFDIVPTYAGSKDKPVGRGVALLSSIKPSIGSKRINLQGDLSVPIVAAETLDVLGCVNFNFLIITPFSHPAMSIAEDRTYWKRTSTMLIGHRGTVFNSLCAAVA